MAKATPSLWVKDIREKKIVSLSETNWIDFHRLLLVHDGHTT